MKIRLLVIDGPNKGAFYPLRQGENILGRAEDSQIILDDPQVSSRHCTISLEGNKISIKDERSSNGTFVNGKIIKVVTLRGNEKISVGPFVFMFGAEKSTQEIIPQQENGETLAEKSVILPTNLKSTTSATAASEKALYKKIFNKFNEIVLPVLHDFNKKNEWWAIVITLFLSYVVLNIALSVYPIVESAKESVIREAERRADYIARQIAELNQEYIANGQEQYLDTSFANKDRSVEEAMIVSLNGRVLAPGFRLNEISTNTFLIRTLKQIKSGDQKHWSLKRRRNQEKTKVIVSVPIFVRSEKSGLNTPKAISVVKFSLSGIALDLGTIAVIYFEALITAIILGIICIYLISQLTYKPIMSANDNIDKVLRGIETNMAKPYQFEPLNKLIDSINSSLSRIPNLVSTDEKKEVKTTDNEQQIIETMLLSIENIVIHASKPMMLLGTNSEIIAMNPSFEELCGIHLSTAQNQKITEAARDEAFIAMMRDMLQEAPERGLGGVIEEYEFASGNYSLRCLAIQSLPEKTEGFLITATNPNESEEMEEYV